MSAGAVALRHEREDPEEVPVWVDVLSASDEAVVIDGFDAVLP